MLKISTKGRYGLRVMVQLAEHFGEGPVLLTEISATENISHKYAEHLIRLLKKTKLLKAYRGASGGYELNTDPKKIKILTILEALEGQLSLVKCIHSPEYCNKVEFCPTRFVWQKLEKSIRDTLLNITLADLVKDNSLLGKN
jgi:Rrf2 family protein